MQIELKLSDGESFGWDLLAQKYDKTWGSQKSFWLLRKVDGGYFLLSFIFLNNIVATNFDF